MKIICKQGLWTCLNHGKQFLCLVTMTNAARDLKQLDVQSHQGDSVRALSHYPSVTKGVRWTTSRGRLCISDNKDS